MVYASEEGYEERGGGTSREAGRWKGCVGTEGTWSFVATTHGAHTVSFLYICVDVSVECSFCFLVYVCIWINATNWTNRLVTLDLA